MFGRTVKAPSIVVVEFIQSFSGTIYRAGERAGFPPDQAQSLIKVRLAKLVEPAAAEKGSA